MSEIRIPGAEAAALAGMPEASGASSGGMRRAVGGFAMLAVTTVGTQAIGFAALAITARRVGPINLGAYNFAYGLAFYFSLPVNFGIGLLGMRDIARARHRMSEVLGEVLVLQVMLIVVSYGALLALSPLIANDHGSRVLLPVAGLAVVLFAATPDWPLQAAQRQRPVAVARLAGQALFGVLAISLVSGGLGGIRTYAWVNIVGIVLTLATCVGAAWRVGGRPRLSADAGRLWARLRSSAPIGLALLMGQIYLSLDSVLLGYLRGSGAVGQYSVAYKLPLALTAFTVLWTQTLYPHAAELIDRRPDLVRRHLTTACGLTVLVSLPLGVGATLVGGELMPALFGSAFGPAGTPFILLVWSMALTFVAATYVSALMAAGEERSYAAGVSCATVVNVVLNVVLIPVAGATGAAAATIVTQATVLGYVVWRTPVTLRPIAPEPRRVARTALASLAMAGVLLLARGVDVFPRIVLGMVVYALVALAVGSVRREELAEVLGHRGGSDRSNDVEG